MVHRIYRKVAPEEEKIIKPTGLPALPLANEDAFLEFQKFLSSDINFYPVVSIVSLFVCSSDIVCLQVKLNRYTLFHFRRLFLLKLLYFIFNL